jgi:hypothetical protein
MTLLHTVAALEDELKARDRARIEDLRREIDEQRDLISRQRVQKPCERVNMVGAVRAIGY